MSFKFLQAKPFHTKQQAEEKKEQQEKQAQLLTDLSGELTSRNWMY